MTNFNITDEFLDDAINFVCDIYKIPNVKNTQIRAAMLVAHYRLNNKPDTNDPRELLTEIMARSWLLRFKMNGPYPPTEMINHLFKLFNVPEEIPAMFLEKFDDVGERNRRMFQYLMLSKASEEVVNKYQNISVEEDLKITDDFLVFCLIKDLQNKAKSTKTTLKA